MRLIGAAEAACDAANPEALSQVLRQLRRTLRIAQPVIVGVPSTAAIVTTVSPLVVNSARASLAVQFELQQQLPFDLADAAWHYRWLSSNGQTTVGGSRLKALGSRRGPPASNFPGPTITKAEAGHLPASAAPSASAVVAAMRESLLTDRLACCRRAGLSVQAVTLNPLATLNAWQLRDERAQESSAILLNVISEHLVEWVVRSPSRLQVVPVTLSRDDWMHELTASWEALQAETPSVGTRVWATGRLESFASLEQECRSRLGVSLERFDTTQIAAAEAIRVQQPERFVAAIGLALQGLGAAALPLNLLANFQDEARALQRCRVANLISGLCLLAAMVLGASGMMAIHRRHAYALASLEQRTALYQSLRPDVRVLLQRQQRLQQRVEQLEQLADQRLLMVRLVAQVADVLPERVWLTKLEWSKDGLVDGLLEGRAMTFQDVTALFDRLKTLAGMSTVKTVSTTVVMDPATGKESLAFVVQLQRPLRAER